jgi:hypothetical protein
MLWDQTITVYTDHKNLMQDALRLTSDQVYYWRLLLEEYSPTIEYIKGIHNDVADTISCLDHGPVSHNRDNWMTFTQCWCHNSETTIDLVHLRQITQNTWTLHLPIAAKKIPYILLQLER